MKTSKYFFETWALLVSNHQYTVRGAKALPVLEHMRVRQVTNWTARDQTAALQEPLRSEVNIFSMNV